MGEQRTVSGTSIKEKVSHVRWVIALLLFIAISINYT